MSKNFLVELIIDTVNLFVGIVAIIISVYYSFKWLLYTGTPFILAISMASIYVLFINVVFEGGIGLIKQAFIIKNNAKKIMNDNKTLYKKACYMKNIRVLIGILILCIWLLLTAYSMSSTVAGQYEQLSIKETTTIENTKDETYYEDQINSIIVQIEFIKNENTLHENEIAMLIKRNESIETIEDRYKYRNTTNNSEKRIDTLRTFIQQNNSKIQSLMEEQRELEKQNYSDFKIGNGNVYEYFSKLTGKEPLLIQFILALFPSIFIDIIAPVSLAIFLYRKRNNGKIAP